MSKQIKKFHCVVTVLRERLVANGLSVEVVAGDPEVVAPSKQLLLEENLKLQEKLKYLQVDPAKLEQLYKVGNLKMAECMPIYILGIYVPRKSVMMFKKKTAGIKKN